MPFRVRGLDPLEAVALVASARREPLLGRHRGRLPSEDLEDCYSQATYELLARVKRGAAYESPVHIANALEQRLVSRVRDRCRAVSGRSPIESALAGALPLPERDGGGVEFADGRADVERLVIQREQLRHISTAFLELTPDQRLVISSQLDALDCATFCRLHRWSPEKYRKVAQRGRARLRGLVGEQSFSTAVPVVAGMSD
jgi:hypothetical protein